MYGSNSTASSLTSSAVSIKAPEFLPSNPSIWFTIMEAQFNIASISTPSTKFYHAVANLPVDTVSNIEDSIINSADYDKLKAAVVAYHESTKGELFDTFLQTTPMTGKPSHYLLEMRKIAKKVGANDDLVRHRFTQALPSNLAPIIATQKSLTLDGLGTLADELVPLLREYNTSEVRSRSSNHNNGKFSSSSGSNYANRYSKHSLTLTPFSDGQRPKVCRCHIFFGNNAKSCRSWCQWPDKAKCRVVQSRNATPNVSRSNSPTGSLNK